MSFNNFPITDEDLLDHPSNTYQSTQSKILNDPGQVFDSTSVANQTNSSDWVNSLNFPASEDNKGFISDKSGSSNSPFFSGGNYQFRDPQINWFNEAPSSLPEGIFREASSNIENAFLFGTKTLVNPVINDAESLFLPGKLPDLNPTQAVPGSLIDSIETNVKKSIDFNNAYIQQLPSTLGSQAALLGTDILTTPFINTEWKLAENFIGEAAGGIRNALNRSISSDTLDKIGGSTAFKVPAAIAKTGAAGALGIGLPQSIQEGINNDNLNSGAVLQNMAYGSLQAEVLHGIGFLFGKMKGENKVVDIMTNTNTPNQESFTSGESGLLSDVGNSLKASMADGQENYTNNSLIQELAKRQNITPEEFINNDFQNDLDTINKQLDDNQERINQNDNDSNNIINGPDFTHDNLNGAKQSEIVNQLSKIPKDERSAAEQSFLSNNINTSVSHRLKQINNELPELRTEDDNSFVKQMSNPKNELESNNNEIDNLNTQIQANIDKSKDLKGDELTKSNQKKVQLEATKQNLELRNNQLDRLIKNPSIDTPLTDKVNQKTDLIDKQNRLNDNKVNTQNLIRWYNSEIPAVSSEDLDNYFQNKLDPRNELGIGWNLPSVEESMSRVQQIERDGLIKETNKTIDDLQKNNELSFDEKNEKETVDKNLADATEADPDNKKGYPSFFKAMKGCLLNSISRI